MSGQHAATTMPSLPIRSLPTQVLVGLALVVLMACTRGQHFASVDALPSASWAVFFLAGALLRPMWMFPLLFLEASLLDFGSLAAGTISDWCTSPAYWALVPAYGTLWLGGNLYARLHRERWSTVPRLTLVLIATAVGAYLFSKGGFYFFSGRYPDATLAGFAARIPQYFPPALGTLAGYVGAAFALYAVVRRLMPVAARQGARV